MQDVNQTPAPDPANPTTVDPTLDEPGMDAMNPAAGNPSSDAGGDPGNATAPSVGVDDEDDEENGQAS